MSIDPGGRVPQHDPQVQAARITRTGAIIIAVISVVGTVIVAVVTGLITHANDVRGSASATPSTVTVSVPAPAAAPGPAGGGAPGPGSAPVTTSAPAQPSVTGGHPVWNLPTTVSPVPFGNGLSTGPQNVAGRQYAETLYNNTIVCEYVPSTVAYRTDGAYHQFTAQVGVATGDDGATATFSVRDGTGRVLGDPVTAQVGQPAQALDVPISGEQEIVLMISSDAQDCVNETGAFIDPEVS